MSPAARHRAALRETTIATLRDSLAAQRPAGAERVILFGSLARGDFDGASDADVLVIGRAWPNAPFETATDRPVEILLWTPEQWAKALADRNPFAEEIARDGIELWRAAA